MGNYDISRVNLNPKQHYTSVRMQQGRVLTDDDWNENERIDKENERQSFVDIIGPYGSPDDGFSIVKNTVVIQTLPSGVDVVNFDIEAGRMYLGGLRLELDAKENYRNQKDWLQFSDLADPAPVPVFNAGETEKYDIAYLEAWQQPVCAVEDSALFEVALGGPDTTTRVKNMRRVHIERDIATCSCEDAWTKLKFLIEARRLGIITDQYEAASNARLRVTYNNTIPPEDLCQPAIAGGYLGAENQAIRVQVIDSGSFTWGFDNASPLYRVKLVSVDGAVSGKTIQMLTEPKDQYHWPLSGQVVEILPWSAVLANGEKVAALSGHLTTVDDSYDPDSHLFSIIDAVDTVSDPAFGMNWKKRDNFDKLDDTNPPVEPPPLIPQPPDEYFYMRVWNRGSFISAPAVPIIPGAIPLGNTGVSVTFSGNQIIPNDFWVIAARPETPNVIVPWELQQGTGIAPHGIRRFFAPLAIIKWTLDPVTNTISGNVASDCRKKFNPLTEQECCCTFTVGDGRRSKGDFNSIQQAIDNLPPGGGKICVLPGEHSANVSIFNKRQVRITGCGDQSIVAPADEERPVFTVENSQRIQIDQLTITPFKGVGIVVRDRVDSKAQMVSEQITINENRILAGIQAINVDLKVERIGESDINILYNKIGILDGVAETNGVIDKTKIQPAIFCRAVGVLIERNRIVVVPGPGKDSDDPTDPSGSGDGDPFNPCITKEVLFKSGFSRRYQYFRVIEYISLYRPSGTSEVVYTTLGGIQIGAGSELVRIKENDVIGGSGNGVTLGSLYSKGQDGNNNALFMLNNGVSYSPLYEICIEENRIQQMGLSGISSLMGTETVLAEGQKKLADPHVVKVNDITIYRNMIRYCCRQVDPEVLDMHIKYLAYGGIVLGFCKNGQFEENRIEENGLITGIPVCGVFVMSGEQMNISTNKIINNGLQVLTNDDHVIKGNRGGIVIQFVLKIPDLMKFLSDLNAPVFDAVPTLTAHDNVVVQPHGHALFLLAFGPVSIVSNQFTSMGTDHTNPYSFLASTIFLLNLGISKDILLFALKSIFKGTVSNPGHASALNMRATMVTTNSAVTTGNVEETPANRLLKIFQVLQYLPNGKVMFSSNQVTLDMRAPNINFCFTSQIIVSLDDIAYNSNESECVSFVGVADDKTTFDLIVTDVFLLAVSVRSNDNRFTEGTTFGIGVLKGNPLLLFSLISFGGMNTAMGNQSSHCLIVGGLRFINRFNIVLIPDLCKNTRIDENKEDELKISNVFKLMLAK